MNNAWAWWIGRGKKLCVGIANYITLKLIKYRSNSCLGSLSRLALVKIDELLFWLIFWGGEGRADRKNLCLISWDFTFPFTWTSNCRKWIRLVFTESFNTQCCRPIHCKFYTETIFWPKGQTKHGWRPRRFAVVRSYNVLRKG